MDMTHLRRIREACSALARTRDAAAVRRAQEASGLSEAQFRRIFKKYLGVAPKRYQHAVRRMKLHASLAEGKSVDDAIFAAGFETPSRVYDEVDQLLGMSPGAYMKGGPGEVIRFALDRSDLGRVLVALTARGICAVLLGDRDAALRQDLKARFPGAVLHEDDTLGEYLAIVLALIEAPELGCALPLDLRGTAFQEQVWRHLRDIEPGTTTTYGEIARRLGKPGSARAVAGACGANGIAVAVPCHRVVEADGQLRGFRWGLERKAALLRREREGRVG